MAEEGTVTTTSNSTAGDSAEKPAVNRNKCAACKYQRRRCADDCALFPYFPTDKTKEFMAAHAVFGVKNMTSLLTQIPLHRDREAAAASLVWEATAWAQDPVNGPLGLYRKLERENKLLANRLLLAKRQTPAATASSQYYQTPAYGGHVDGFCSGWYRAPEHGQGFYYGGDDGAVGPRGVMSSNFPPVQNHVSSAAVHHHQPLLMENGGRGRDSFYTSNNLTNGVRNNDNTCYYNDNSNNNNYGGGYHQQQRLLVMDQMVQHSNQDSYGRVPNYVHQQQPLPIATTSYHNRGSQEIGRQAIQYEESSTMSREEGSNSKSSGVADQ